MRRVVYGEQALLAHVRVDLGGPHACMTQELLYNSKVCAAVQQMSRKTMPQSMRVRRRRRPPVQYTAHVSGP